MCKSELRIGSKLSLSSLFDIDAELQHLFDQFSLSTMSEYELWTYG